jgi:hypothetical protein
MKFQLQTPIVVSHQLVKFFAPPIRGFGEILVGILKIPPNVTLFSICSISDIFFTPIEYNLILNSSDSFSETWFISLRDIAGQTLQKSCFLRF